MMNTVELDWLLAFEITAESSLEDRLEAAIAMGEQGVDLEYLLLGTDLTIASKETYPSAASTESMCYYRRLARS
jgi:hypothetical protein